MENAELVFRTPVDLPCLERGRHVKKIPVYQMSGDILRLNATAAATSITKEA